MNGTLLIWVTFVSLINFGTANKIDDLYSKFHQNEYKVIFERSTLHYVNKSLAEFELKSFVYNRTMKAANVSFLIFDDYNSQDFRLLVQFKNFLSNEYRVFPIRFETNLCKSVNENIGGLGSAITCGNFTGCPLKKNTKYFACNNIVDSSRYPPLIPTGQYLMEISILDQKYTMVTFYSYIKIVYDTKVAPRCKSRDC